MTMPLRQDDVLDLYRRYARGGVSRREFMRHAAALGIAGSAASALGALAGNEAAAAGLAAQAARRARRAEAGARPVRVELHVGEREAGRHGDGQLRRRPADVRRVHGAHASPEAVPGRARARWRGTGHWTGWARPMAVRAGSSTSAAEGYQGLRRRSAGAWTLAAPSRRARRLSRRAPNTRGPAGQLHAAARPTQHRTSIRRTTRSGRVPATSASPMSTSFIASQGGSYVQQQPPGGAPGRQGGPAAGRQGGAGRRGAGGAAVAGERSSPRVRPTWRTRRGARRAPSCSTRSAPRSS